MVLGPHLYAKVGYDTLKGFEPIVQVSESALVIVGKTPDAKTDARPLSLKDVIAKGKAGGITWATPGNGSMPHMVGEAFKSAAGIKLLQIPYKGAGPALTDLVGGSVDVAMMTVPSVLSLVRSAKIAPIAVGTTKRAAMLPDTPTLTELGIKMDARVWLGLFAPAGTPRAIVDRLNAEVNKVLQMPDVKEKISNGGAVVAGGTSKEFASLVRTDYAYWGKVVKDSGVKLED